jgi:predicted TIM-barrel fold metal-dependent hydrolase
MIFPNVAPTARFTAGTPHRGQNFNKNQDIYREHAERGWSPQVQLEAMDTEGIDRAVLFPTRGLGILTYPDQDPRFARALARAYNDWLHDFCQGDPNRLLGAGMISV